MLQMRNSKETCKKETKYRDINWFILIMDSLVAQSFPLKSFGFQVDYYKQSRIKKRMCQNSNKSYKTNSNQFQCKKIIIFYKSHLHCNNLMQSTQMIKQKIDIEDNKETIEYYEYLRTITEVTELSYWIGNPSVQIISGKILLQPFSPIQSKTEPESFQLYLKQIKKANLYKIPDQNQSQSQIKMREFQESINMNKQPLLVKTNSDISNKQITQQLLQKKPLQKKSIKSRCLILCGISNSKSPVQVMQTDSISRNKHLIKQIRVIKTVHIRYYGMLLLMQSQTSASQFFNDLFASQYNDLEMEKIIIRQIKSITLTFTQLNIDGGNNQMNLLRSINQHSEFISPQNIFMTYHYQKLKQKNQLNQAIKQDQLHQAIKQNQLNQTIKQNTSELVCAICFQECNQQTISILCGHYFDIECLQKWSENICPLCRYHQQPPIIKFCEECNQCQGLWVCLICGSRLCCGVKNDILSQDSHIYIHYKITSHSLSMELQTKFLFDAKIPAFLHQKFYKDLIQNRNEQQKMMQQKNVEESNKKNKISYQIQQYELQVAEQMKRQRLYFEEQINQNVKQHRNILSKRRCQVEQIRSQIEKMDQQQKQTLKQIKQSEETSIKKSKQLQIVGGLIKIKEQKVAEKKQKFKINHQIKFNRLRQLQNQIKQKKQQILNYRKNLKLKQKLTQKLKGEQVQNQVMIEQEDRKKKKKKTGNK